MRKAFPIAQSTLWLATLVGCVAAAYFAARLETHAAALSGSRKGAAAVANSQTRNHDVLRPDRRNRPFPSEHPSSAAWMRVPVRWLDHYRADVGDVEVHRLLKLDPMDAERLGQAAEEAMNAAKSRQIAEIEDPVMTEGRTLLIPALDEEAISALIRSVTAALPENLSAAENQLVAFLMERELRRKYGRDLEVSLEFTGGFANFSDLRHSPRHLVGFRFVARPVGWQVGERFMSHSVGGSGRFDFLELHPDVSNEGRNPLNR